MTDSKRYLNTHGVEISHIQPGDKVHYGTIITGIVTRIEWFERKVWGLYDGGGGREQWLGFNDVYKYEPQFKPYDPTQMGDKDDDI
jgi:hypothetical protein